jgi:hypothetical protein
MITVAQHTRRYIIIRDTSPAGGWMTLGEIPSGMVVDVEDVA